MSKQDHLTRDCIFHLIVSFTATSINKYLLTTTTTHLQVYLQQNGPSLTLSGKQSSHCACQKST